MWIHHGDRKQGLPVGFSGDRKQGLPVGFSGDRKQGLPVGSVVTGNRVCGVQW